MIMDLLQNTFGRFLMQVFILLPVFLIAFFSLTLVLYKRAPKGSELRRKRQFWFRMVCIVGGIMLLLWLAFMAVLFFAVSCF